MHMSEVDLPERLERYGAPKLDYDRMLKKYKTGVSTGLESGLIG
jgi:hypothetical protein